ncbi:GPI inositol-deacylase isoform X2 [Hyperolius riggenbachi]|uniref:GPI inositol-deacylase isoform X2 n=1 Tax=Hyperolius riggenbachi TaxID=752182 RepID=UPI0035A3982B
MKLASAVFNGILLILVTLGVWEVFLLYEDNRCSMTYMFEYPEYQKIKLPKKMLRLYPTYELYLYGEGVYAEINQNLSLNGIPLLFLPGNAGSYKQARSIGSIALRKAENIDYRYHFNVFSVNFNEELVALYGGSLQRQTEFVYICIKTILRLYKNQEFPPQSVIILGHSMGGLIARALLTLKNFKPELINLIITQATPHVMPVLSLDHYLIDFYAMVNEYWTLNAKDLQNVTVLSVAGGFRDFQVRSGLTFLPVSSIHTSALSVVSTAVPRTWASTDHLSIVWCKELILATSRALFDLIDEQTRQITDDPEKRLSVLKHHFIRHPAKLYEDSYETVLSISESSTWLPIVTTSWKYLATGVCNETYFEFPLQDKRHRYSHFHCRSTFLYTHSWIFGCEKKSVKCLKIEDLSWKAELLPTAKIITLKLDEFHNISHLVIYLPPTNNTKFAVECEFLKEESITQELPVTHALSFGFSSNRININSSGLLHVLQLHGFSKIYQAFDLLIEKDCKQSTENVPNMFRFHVPWSNADIIRTSRYLATGNSFTSLHYHFLLGISTIQGIVHETCKAIWNVLQPLFMPQPTMQMWREAAEGFRQNAQFPNCIGALDGKHLQIQVPPNSGSLYYNYKKYFSVVLMAIVDTTYKFLAIDVGAYGSTADANVFRLSPMGRRLYSQQFDIPEPRPLVEGGEALPHVLVGDEAFGLHVNLLKPFPKRDLNDRKRLFNFRLTMARRYVESTFGILANKWRVLRSCMQLKPDNVDFVIKATCVLHNYLRTKDPCAEDQLEVDTLPDLAGHAVRGNVQAANVRDKFAAFFMSQDGQFVTH